jgi:DNA-binding winged helix-turn-helix (wHTH) protein
MEMETTSMPMQHCNSYCLNCSISDELKFGNILSLSPIKHVVNINGNEIKFPNRSFRVLCALLRSVNTPVSFDFLNQYGWPDKSVVRNNLAVTISEIRTLLRQTDMKIVNVRGFGYLLTTSADSQDNIEVTNV